MLGNGHAGFGERPGETDSGQPLHRAPGRLNFPDPTGQHVCERRARDVASADHLYVKSAAIAWLLDQDHQGAVHLREPLGSVVDIAWEHGTRGLRLIR
ncbi:MULTISPECIES: hypothetical protein [unclassified Kitasatospora]|uniref:hypothetical protein n=1 Tax=unclassified Kitasatospora TaxID=2633591 RepID=UPI0037FA73BA